MKHRGLLTSARCAEVWDHLGADEFEETHDAVVSDAVDVKEDLVNPHRFEARQSLDVVLRVFQPSPRGERGCRRVDCGDDFVTDEFEGPLDVLVADAVDTQ